MKHYLWTDLWNGTGLVSDGRLPIMTARSTSTDAERALDAHERRARTSARPHPELVINFLAAGRTFLTNIPRTERFLLLVNLPAEEDSS